jgi:uncharacterized phage protein gp47/JayE
VTQSVLTALGFERKRYADFISEMQEQAKTLFGTDVNLSDDSPMGQWIKLQSFAHAEANELTEKVWLSSHIDTAEGVALDYQVKKYGITRYPSQAATGSITLTLNNGQTIAGGALTVSTTNGIKFTNSVGGTAVGTSLTLPIVAVLDGGQGNVPANTLTVISTPIAGVTAVTNAAPTTGGRSTETDPQLRERYYETLARTSGPTTDGVRAALLEVPDIRAAVVIENVLDVNDSYGNPPHCIAPVVLGGSSSDIVAAILSKKAGGIRSYGSQTAIIKDDSGFDQTIGFSYATKADIYVTVNLTKNSAFPTNGAELVETEVIKYIGGTDSLGTIYAGLGMAASVVHSQIVGAIIRNVAGVVDLDVTLKKGAGGSFAASNITIGAVEVAETDAVKVISNVSS